MNDTDKIEALVGRVSRLENQNRRFRRVGATLVVVLIAVVLSGQSPSSKGKTKRVIEAEEFILRDKNGMKRGWWHTLDDGSPFLRLSGADEQMHSDWGVEADRGVLAFASNEGPYASLQVDAQMASLVLGRLAPVTSIKDGKVKVILEVLPEIKLYADKGGSVGVKCSDKNGVPRVLLVTSPDGSPGLYLYDNKRRTRATLGCGGTVTPATGVKHTYPESTLLLMDKDGEVIFEAP